MRTLSGRYGVGISNCRSSREVIDGIRRAESLGTEIAFVAEDINCRNAFELLAVAATQSESIRLGTGVVNPFTRNPTTLAMAIATLDEISGGRAVLGLGTSSPTLITTQMGIARQSTIGVMRETTEIVRCLLTGEQVTVTGKHFVYQDARLEVPAVQKHVPIIFAAMGPRMLRLAGAVADGVLLNVGASTRFVRWAVGEVKTGCQEAGRSAEEVTIYAWMSAYVVGDRQKGMQRAREWLAGMLSIPQQGELLLERGGFDPGILPGIRALVGAYPEWGDRTAAAAHVPPVIAEQMALIGNRDEVLDRLAQYRDAGVQVPVLSLAALEKLC